ncbi:hypothetical protein [Microbulbifer sp. TYP-18]|uniref:hypothetical protein n=1 Tax=Microbulbifer sp. TYP-18 TaxID=3230024 RepID=UPI0034C5FA0B
MAFTDAQLGHAMSQNLVDSGVMTADQAKVLLEDPTENNVRDSLTEQQLANFQKYWQLLGDWMAKDGGNIAETTGNNVPGRDGGNPGGLGPRALYNDAFRDVNQHINQPGFLPVKAVSNQLRFVSFFCEE